MRPDQRFATEEACRAYLVERRWPDGFRCPHCGADEAGEMHRRRLVWQCRSCAHQTSVTAGTVMHGTHTPLRHWFRAAYLVATQSHGISARGLSRELGMRYETAWLILQKLRRAMVASERDVLRREVEADHFFLDEPAGTPCAVAVEVQEHGFGRVRFDVLPDPSWRSMGAFVTATTEPGAIVHTGAWRADVAVSKLRTWLSETHRRVSAKHLAVYLAEFTFRSNHSGAPTAAFQTLLGLGTQREPSTYPDISRTQPDIPSHKKRPRG